MEGFDTTSYQEINRMQQIEQMKKMVLGKVLTKEAYERLSRVRVANPQLAAQAELYLLQIYQTGKLQGTRISDEKMKEVLRTLNVNQDFKIRRM